MSHYTNKELDELYDALPSVKNLTTEQLKKYSDTMYDEYLDAQYELFRRQENNDKI